MKRILAFEGDQELAEELEAALWRYGCNLEIVDDEEVGLKKALEERPDLILLSIELPKTNGFSICNKLKKNKTLRAIPLIITSAECSEETFEQHKLMQTKAEGYLHKPFTVNDLMEMVRRLIPLEGARPGSSSAPPDENDEPTEMMEPVRLTDIYNSIDGAFDEIQDAEEPDEDDEEPRFDRTVIGVGLPRAPEPEPAEPPESSPRLALVPTPSSPPGLPMAAATEGCLLVLWSPDAKLRGQSYCLRPDAAVGDPLELHVGRDPDNEIAIDDRSLSQRHFRVERTNAALFLRDLGSGSGTFVNDELVSYQELEGGELIRAGSTTLLCLHGLSPEEQVERMIHELSVLDPMTRVYSTRALRERLDRAIEDATQELTTLSLAAVAVDDLYQIVYRYGDLVAERVIEEVATMLKSTTPQGTVGRDVGAGFLVVLPGKSQKMAVGQAEGWRFEASVSEIVLGEHSVTPTLSVGVLEWREGWTATDLIRRAYRLLWEATNAGGNRVLSRSKAERRSSEA